MFELGQSPLVTSVAVAGRVERDTISGSYTLLPQKYYNSAPHRNALGLVGGAEVSMITGNLVDLESDLRGTTRDASRAPSKKYQPACVLGDNYGNGSQNELAAFGKYKEGECGWPNRLVFTERGTNRVQIINTQPRHLPTQQMFSYPGVPAPEPLRQDVYGAPWRF